MSVIVVGVDTPGILGEIVGALAGPPADSWN
jgi:hypothetical protein